MGGADRLDEHALEELIHRTVVDITRQIAKIDLRLCSQDPDPANELCTLRTTIDGDYHTELVLHADRALLHRLTENMMEAKTTDPEDMEEYSKEFFNVLCGHIVSEIFRRTKLPARFHTPCFAYGDTDEEKAKDKIRIRYASDQAERAELLHDKIAFE
ncbi:chemotaxis protein CheX [Anaerotruncus colihominis]|uniref:Chemotaxis phosphatase CheX-like domain-containing protein n=1 Tax=Anaerotruncus colihominis TaxID=169435 RepID=A0A3E3IPB9_9FIRM|nr:chemotaxis protein CheX [Anaerotruncus colihominis]RGE68939.1 hypothetical protein DXC40_06525 [Anaerotruncus colihominis]